MQKSGRLRSSAGSSEAQHAHMERGGPVDVIWVCWNQNPQDWMRQMGMSLFRYIFKNWVVMEAKLGAAVFLYI